MKTNFNGLWREKDRAPKVEVGELRGPAMAAIFTTNALISIIEWNETTCLLDVNCTKESKQRATIWIGTSELRRLSELFTKYADEHEKLHAPR